MSSENRGLNGKFKYQQAMMADVSTDSVPIHYSEFVNHLGELILVDFSKSDPYLKDFDDTCLEILQFFYRNQKRYVRSLILNVRDS